MKRLALGKFPEVGIADAMAKMNFRLPVCLAVLATSPFVAIVGYALCPTGTDGTQEAQKRHKRHKKSGFGIGFCASCVLFCAFCVLFPSVGQSLGYETNR